MPDLELKVVQQVRGPKKSAKGDDYYEVQHGGVWYFCYQEPMFELLKECAGKKAAFQIQPDPKYPKIKGFIQVENRFFDPDGITPQVQRDEPRGGKLF